MTVDRASLGSPAVRRLSQNRNDSLGDVLERVLDKGVVIVGDVVVSVLDVELLTLKLRLFIASADTARELGLDWWTADPFYNSKAAARQEHRQEHRHHDRHDGEDEDENRALRSRVAALERALSAGPPAATAADAGVEAGVEAAVEAGEPARPLTGTGQRDRRPDPDRRPARGR